MLFETRTQRTIAENTTPASLFAMQETETTHRLVNELHVHRYTGIVPPAPRSRGRNDHIITQAQICPKDYHVFSIPKASGGMRTITAPNEQLKEQQNALLRSLSSIMSPPHPAVHSYLPKQSALTEMQVHQQNGSRWFLKCDIKDFFPSITPTLIKDQLMKQYTFATNENAADYLTLLEDLAYYEGGLPQGAPTSPFLSNFALYEFDYIIERQLNMFERQFCYTRYADDLLISAPADFSRGTKDRVLRCIASALRAFDLELKESKTRYGSNAGRNWNLGLMYNKDMNITIGHDRKKKIKHRLYQFIGKYLEWRQLGNENEQLNPIVALQLHLELQELNGELSYLRHIEPAYHDYLLTKYEAKFNISIRQIRKELL